MIVDNTLLVLLKLDGRGKDRSSLRTRLEMGDKLMLDTAIAKVAKALSFRDEMILKEVGAAGGVRRC